MASPLGFSATTRPYYRDELLPRLADAGYRLLDPWEGAPTTASDESRLSVLQDLNRAIGQRNAALIDRSDAVLAVLDGVDIDSGTAAEIGYAAARSKPVVGLRTDLRRSGENAAATVNVQVDYFIRAGGGRVVASLEEALELLRTLVPSVSKQ